MGVAIPLAGDVGAHAVKNTAKIIVKAISRFMEASFSS
jgi:hypothetical protein